MAVTDPDSQTWQYTYNAHGDLTSATAPDGIVRDWTYNTSQRLTSETHPESGQVVYSNFDSADVSSRKTDARGTVVDTVYDHNYRVTQVTAGTRVTTTTYESGTDHRASTSVGGVATTFGYDSAGRLAARTDVISGRSYQRIFGYDSNDRLTTLTYPSGRQITYQYDTADRITTVTDVTASRDIATTFSYHPSGSPTAFTSGNGIVNAVGYDSSRYWPRTLSAGVLSLTYDHHDGSGNIGTIGDSRPGMGQTFGYDNVDRLTSAAGPYGSLTYAYNAHGNRQTAGGVTYTYQASTLRLLSQNSTSFGYDNSGNMTSAGSSTFSYTTEQQLDTATVGGVTTSYGYDGDGWRATKSRSGQVSDYLRGPGGELLAEVQNPGTSFVVTRDYIYAGSRLLAVTGGVTPSITFTDPTITTGVTPVKAVHLTELRQAVDGYRAAAGLSAATWTDASLTNTPIKAVHIQELRARLDEARAALGYAAASYTDPTLTAGSSSIRAVHFTELRALMQAPGASSALRYYHSDVLGSVRMTTDHAGAVIARFDYQPFGEPLAASSEPRRFTGAERDAETGFDYFGARYLHEGIGRFGSVDPGHVNGNIGDPQSWNGYAYARNNPLKYADPTGTEYVICGIDQYGFTSNCGPVSDAYFGRLERNPGAGLRLSGGEILAGDRVVGYYSQTSVDPTLASVFGNAGLMADAWLKSAATEMAVGAAVAATGGLAAGALGGGLVAESLSITGRLAPLRYGKAAGKLARQMAQRGWTDDMIREAVASGQKVTTTNFANGNPAIRFIHPRTGQSVIVDTVTKEIIMVGGRGFRF